MQNRLTTSVSSKSDLAIAQEKLPTIPSSLGQIQKPHESYFKRPLGNNTMIASMRANSNVEEEKVPSAGQHTGLLGGPSALPARDMPIP